MTTSTKGKIMSETFVSCLVSNAEIDGKSLLKKIPEAPVELLERSLRAVVLQVTMGEKRFLCCMAGGKITSSNASSEIRAMQSGDDIAFTQMGKITLEVALQFIPKENSIIFKEMKCDTSKSNMQRKITEVFDFAKDGYLVVFVGDIAGSCDGEILPLLNVQKGISVELPKFY